MHNEFTKISCSSTFAAIDFETADYGRNSACAAAVVRVENNIIVERFSTYIRPPREDFIFTYLHGISWSHVADALTFAQIWPVLEKKLKGADFIAAHNATFDRSVLNECCKMAGIKKTAYNFQCTMKLARRIWNIYPTGLQNVCKYLNIPLNHHQASSDAEACARIIIAARGVLDSEDEKKEG